MVNYIFKLPTFSFVTITVQDNRLFTESINLSLCYTKGESSAGQTLTEFKATNSL
jgi:hypothetical protein